MNYLIYVYSISNYIELKLFMTFIKKDLQFGFRKEKKSKTNEISREN